MVRHRKQEFYSCRDIKTIREQASINLVQSSLKFHPLWVTCTFKYVTRFKNKTLSPCTSNVGRISLFSNIYLGFKALISYY